MIEKTEQSEIEKKIDMENKQQNSSHAYLVLLKNTE